MGVMGSFPLFHLTHYSILDGLVNNHPGLQGVKRPAFAVLGDDVLIADKDLKEAYLELLVRLGVSVSGSKTFQKGGVGQFAGFTGITSDKGVTIFRPFKHGPNFTLDRRDIQLLDVMGAKVRDWGKRWS